MFFDRVHVGVVLGAVVAGTVQAGDVNALVLDRSNLAYATTAAGNLGFNLTVVTNDATFLAQLTGSVWDIVVVDQPATFISTGSADAIDDYVTAGGIVVLSYWNMDHSSAAQLRATFGIASTVDFFSPMSVRRWDAAHPIFSNPNAIGDIPEFGDFWNDNGDRAEPAAGAIAIAGFVALPTPGEAAIIVANDGRTVVNTFLYDDMDGPTVTSLIENELAFAVRTTADRTLIIKQGACPAPVKSASRGLTPMLLVGDEDFDVSLVDLSSLELTRCDGVGGVVAPHSGPPGPESRIVDLNHPNLGEVGCGEGQVPCACNEDQSSDGIDDLQLKFDTSDMAEALVLDGEPAGSIITLFLSGDLTDGTRFVAADCIRIVAPPVSSGMLLVGATVPNVWVGATPLDLIFDGGGFASFERAYLQGSVVELTAPTSFNGWMFLGWDLNGLPVGDLEPTVFIAVTDETTTAFARYQRLGDLNGDGVVGIPDLLALLGAWGPCSSCSNCPADVDGDCQVSVLDLLILLTNWG